MAELSKQPTGLAIHRQGRKFTFSWKIGAKDYDDGQKVGYNLGYPKDKVMTYMKNVGTHTTSKSIKIDESKYYPNKKKKLNRVQFGVAGNRDGSKYTWSKFSGKDFILKVPHNAKAYVADSDSADNKAVFGWKVVTSDTSERYFVDVEWESVLIRNCTFKATEGKKAFAKATAKVGTKKKGTSKNATDSVTIKEDSSAIYDLNNNSYTRWFRVRARGPRGHSKKWAYARYVHGQPGITKNVKPQVKVLASSYEVTVKWSSVRSPKQPIDKMVVQYVKATPNDVDLGYTSDSGWTDARTIAPKDGTDAAHFTVDGLLDSNQCLYVRINTYHDGYVTNGAPILALAGRLNAPTSMTANYNSGTNKVSVSISGGTTVPGAFHAVLVGNGFDAPVCIGIIPSGSSSVTNVSCPPDFVQSDNFFGVYAVVGEYAYNSAISYGIYDVAPILASSETLWQTGSVLVKPSNVKAVQAEGKEDTARVSWDWNWEGATGAELSWADHDDAWESTDEPSKYSVEIINAPHWNISNLETGKKWYIRVRFYKTEGDATFYGMWSDIAICDLSSAPNIPVLELSAEAVAAGGEFVATWVYTTNDGTPQAYASICEATIANGTVTYGDEVANAQTEQRVVLNVDELMANHGWSVGNTYYLCVKVRSESGHDSDGWSEPMPIRLVEPLECIITSTSLVEEEIEVNPRDFSANPATFETEMEEDVTKMEISLSPIQEGTGDPSPTNVRPITGHDSVKVEIIGVNIWNEEWVNGYYATGTGAFVSNANMLANKTPIKVMPSTAYYLHTGTYNISIFYYDADMNFIVQSAAGGSREFTTPANCRYINFANSWNSGATYNNDISINYPSTDQDYHAYQGQTIAQDFNVTLTPTVIDETPYLFKQTGDVRGDKESLELVGGTVNWNQLFGHNTLYNGSADGITVTVDDVNKSITVTGTATADTQVTFYTFGGDDGGFIKDHIYYLAQPSGASASTYFIRTGETSFWSYKNIGKMVESTAYPNLRIRVMNGQTVNFTFKPRFTDLTAFFANDPSIADYVYSLEQANAGAGIAWLRKYFPDLFAYSPYNTGTLESVKPTAHVTRGVNQWDEIAELGYINELTGEKGGSTIRLCSKNYIPIVPNTEYYFQHIDVAKLFWYDSDKKFIGSPANWGQSASFTSPNNCYYAMIGLPEAYGTTYKNDYCLNLSDPALNGKYYPADHHTYPITELELRGIPKLVDGELRFDGDTRKASGSNNVNRKYGIVEIASLPWYSSETGVFAQNTNIGMKRNNSPDHMPNAIATGYVTETWQTINVGTQTDKSIHFLFYDGGQQIRIFDSAYTTLEAFMSAMSGKYLVYEKATPTTETADPFTDPQEVSIYGTEEFVSSNGVPIGNKTTYKTRDIFGGTIDLASGVLTVDRVMDDMGSLNWTYIAGDTVFRTYISDKKDGDAHFVSEIYKNQLDAGYSTGDYCISYSNASSLLKSVFVGDPRYTTAQDFITAVTGKKLVYDLATPLTYQLTPHEIETLIGSNVVTTEDGNLTVRIAESSTIQSVLTELPLKVKVEGAGDDGQTRVAIQRAQAFYLDRPDESQKTGYLDETVLLEEQAGEAEIVFDVDDDFLGTLDDGAAYKIVATISDAFGQRATIEPEPEFVVRWDHQAVVPEATVVADQDEQIVKITPTVPQGADVRDTDVIDIYRLSIDKPKLIYENAKIGETYVDPYPTIGEYGGHRIVFRTQEGDTTTSDKEMAWTDYHERIDTMYNIIEFGNGRLDLIYNIKVNSSWEKDFSQIAYLDGTIIGDWKAGVKRSGDLSSVLITTMDQDMLQQLRRLAEYEGVCHVRTREGSSYAANVDVSINQDMGQNVQIAEVSLSIDRIDSEGLDGMTLKEWEES